MHHLDTSGHVCPLPILKTQKALKSLAVGEQMTIIATDPLALKDMPIYCDDAGHILIACNQIGADKWQFIVQKG